MVWSPVSDRSNIVVDEVDRIKIDSGQDNIKSDFKFFFLQQGSKGNNPKGIKGGGVAGKVAVSNKKSRQIKDDREKTNNVPFILFPEVKNC